MSIHDILGEKTGIRCAFVSGVAAAVLAVPTQSLAQARVEFGDTSAIELGFRLQPQYIHTDSDAGDAGVRGGDENDFHIRRARLRLKGIVNDYVSIFLQSEFSEEGSPGGNAGLIDAFLTLKPTRSDAFQIIAGENMAPVLRQNLTSSGGPMTMDRPGVVYKSLNWGLRSLAQFSNTTFGASTPGIETSDVAVRDLGVTVFGSIPGEGTGPHFKYYAGIYDGSSFARSQDSNHIAVRGQVNFGDPEPGYYQLATYYGALDTIALGVSYATQDEIAVNANNGNNVDYELYSVDVFGEKTLGVGALTGEIAYINLSLDGGGGGAPLADVIGGDGAGAPANQVEGDGGYVQFGYTVGRFQPWAEYETWSSDASDDRGSYDSWRIGLTYLISGHNANFKIGFENYNPDGAFVAGTDADDIQSVVATFFVTY